MTLALIYPLMAQVLLTLLVLVSMGVARDRTLRSKSVSTRDIALDNRNWPDGVRKFGNNFTNQFELPVLFYVLILAAMHTGATNIFTIILAWAFVISRVIHSFIHMTSNQVRPRYIAYGIGAICLLGIWIVIVLKLASSHWP